MGRREWSGDDPENYALPVLCGGKAAVIRFNLLWLQAVPEREVWTLSRCVDAGRRTSVPDPGRVLSKEAQLDTMSEVAKF
jgi:hypothetical protein